MAVPERMRSNERVRGGGRRDWSTWPAYDAAVSAYRMEERLPLVRCPVLCLGADADPFAFPDLDPLARALGAATTVVAGGTVALPDQCPEAVATAVVPFLLHPTRSGPAIGAPSNL